MFHAVLFSLADPILINRSTDLQCDCVLLLFNCGIIKTSAVNISASNYALLICLSVDFLLHSFRVPLKLRHEELIILPELNEISVFEVKQ